MSRRAGVALCWLALVAAGVMVGASGSAVIPLGACLLVAFVVLQFVSPSVAVVLYAATRPLADSAVFINIGGFSVGQLWGAGLVAVLVAYIGQSLTRVVEPVRLHAVPILFLAGYALLTLFRPDAWMGLQNLMKLSSWILLILVVESISATPSNRGLVEKAGVALAILSVVTIVYAMVRGGYGADYYANEFMGSGQGPHGLSLLGVLALPFVLMPTSHGVRRFSGALAVLLCAVIVASLVRTALVAMIAVLGTYAIYVYKPRGVKSVLGFALAFSLLSVGIWSLQDQLAARLNDLSFLSSGGADYVWAGGGRIGIWLSVLQGATDSISHFVFGRGAGASFELVRQGMGVSVWSHNDFIEFLVEGGLMLLGLYIALLAWIGRSLMTAIRSAESEPKRQFTIIAAATFAGFIMMSLLNGVVFYQASIAMGLLVGLVRGQRRDLSAGRVTANQ